MNTTTDPDKISRRCARLCRRIREAAYFNGRHDRAQLLSHALKRMSSRLPAGHVDRFEPEGWAA